MSISPMRKLRRIFPDSNITLHTRSLTEGLLRNASFIDDIISFEKRNWPVANVYDNATFLRDEGFDLALLFPNSFESALTTFLSRIPNRIGYNKDARGLLLTHPVAVPEWKNRRHEVYYYLNLVDEVDRKVLGRGSLQYVLPDVSLEVYQARKLEAIEILSRNGVDRERKTVLLGVGSTNSNAKRWPAERFAVLSDKLQKELGVNVILVGSEGDTQAVLNVVQAARLPPLNLVGSTSVGEAAAVISIADLLISNDMGLAHIAPAVRTRSITIFGPTNVLTTSPFSPMATVLRHDVACSPCMLRECPIDHRCMTGISPETVFETAIAALTESEVDAYETTGSIS